MRDIAEAPTDAPEAAKQTSGGEREAELAPSKPGKSPLRLIILLLVVAAVIAGVVLWWIHSNQYEDTDDAQVNAHLSAVSSRVAGTVTAVYVEENQFVKAGQLIAELDPRDYQNALDQAQSQKAQSEAQVRAVNPNVPITETSNRATVMGTFGLTART